jgi:hypothetical protein
VAGGMKQHTVLRPVGAAKCSPDNMMVMPSREFGDLLVADGTDSLLFHPEVAQRPPVPQVVHHLYAQAFLEVHFPFWIVRIGLSLDFDMPPDRRTFREGDTTVALVRNQGEVTA